MRTRLAWVLFLVLAACKAEVKPGTTGQDDDDTPGHPGPPGCVPVTCAERAFDCGTLPDGCGVDQDCGTCTPGQACGGGGTPNVCGSVDYPVIAVAGDIACNGCAQQATSDLIFGKGFDRVVLLGDNAYDSGTTAEYAAHYAPTWGRFKELTLPAPGNHEYNSGGGGYYDYFGAAAGEAGKGYYSVDLGDWHLIALNTNSSCGAVGCGAGSAQEQWLRADLAANTRKCTLAFWHHPRWSSGEHGNFTGADALVKALYEFGTELVLAGHDHDYERFAPQDPTGARDDAKGLRSFVVGTGGRSFRTFPSVKPNSEVRQADTHGVLKLTLRPDGYDWEFLPVAGKSWTDKGSGTCF